MSDPAIMSFWPSNSCGHCASCNDHAPAYCVEFAQRNFKGSRPDSTSPLSGEGGLIHANIFGQSSFATTYAIARGRNTVKVSHDVPLERLGPLGCGVMTGAGTVMNALQVRAGSSIAISGTGAVGLGAIMAAKVVGAATIIAIDINESRLDLARELGATHTILATRPDLASALAGRAQGPSTMPSIAWRARLSSAPRPTHSVGAVYWA
jgi:aryl-alcohol dehydrogenase